MEQPKDASPIFIYRLLDPRNGEVRYVGKTIKSLDNRLAQHFYDKKGSHKSNWLQSLVVAGLKPVIELIETVPADEDWAEREKYWIAYYRSIGARLTNATDGGEGVTRHNMLTVAQYTLDGAFVRLWESAGVAANKVGAIDNSIRACCKGVSKSSSGYIWRYWLEEGFPPLTLGELDNLELLNESSEDFCDIKENQSVAISQERKIEKTPVVQMTESGEFLFAYANIWQATLSTRIKSQEILDCVEGRADMAGGYKWEVPNSPLIEIKVVGKIFPVLVPSNMASQNDDRKPVITEL